MIQPSTSFKENLQLLPSVEGLAGMELVNAAGEVVAKIENLPGKQGSLAVYHYLEQTFGTLDAKAATHGIDVFGEHTEDAKNRPGAHPNIDRLFAIIDGGDTLNMRILNT